MSVSAVGLLGGQRENPECVRSNRVSDLDAHIWIMTNGLRLLPRRRDEGSRARSCALRRHADVELHTEQTSVEARFGGVDGQLLLLAVPRSGTVATRARRYG